jgi:hypothetical protein
MMQQWDPNNYDNINYNDDFPVSNRGLLMIERVRGIAACKMNQGHILVLGTYIATLLRKLDRVPLLGMLPMQICPSNAKYSSAFHDEMRQH